MRKANLVSNMKRLISLITVFSFISCNKENTGNEAAQIASQLQNEWTLISETRNWQGRPRYTPGQTMSKIQFHADGNAYSKFEGQYGYVYKYNLNATAKTINYKFLLFLQPFMQTDIQTANIKHISDRLLVLENTFYADDGETLTIIDSLKR